MEILNVIREQKISTNWFMKNDNWFCFSDCELYTQDKTKTGKESIVKIIDDIEYNSVLNYYKSKRNNK